jgi:hypothetical protein
VLVAATAGKLYYLIVGSSSGWTQLAYPDGVTSYQSNVWSWAAYEINPVGSTASIDVLLMSNAQDGMIMVRGDNFAVSAITTPKKFGVIERYAERIWGGAIEDDPDMLIYSAPFDPTDWEPNLEIPEDGAGDINQPSWDGDSFTALRAFGNQLIASSAIVCGVSWARIPESTHSRSSMAEALLMRALLRWTTSRS